MKTMERIPIDPAAVLAAQEAALPEESLLRVVEVFAALADPTRARMLYALLQGPLCVRDLAIVVGVSESAVSHQLRFLRERRLVQSQRAGTVIYYAMANSHVAAFFREAGYHVDHVLRGLPDHP